MASATAYLSAASASVPFDYRYRLRMITDPSLDRRELRDALRAGYGIEVTAFTLVPGYTR